MQKRVFLTTILTLILILLPLAVAQDTTQTSELTILNTKSAANQNIRISNPCTLASKGAMLGDLDDEGNTELKRGPANCNSYNIDRTGIFTKKITLTTSDGRKIKIDESLLQKNEEQKSTIQSITVKADSILIRSTAEETWEIPFQKDGTIEIKSKSNGDFDIQADTSKSSSKELLESLKTLNPQQSNLKKAIDDNLPYGSNAKNIILKIRQDGSNMLFIDKIDQDFTSIKSSEDEELTSTARTAVSDIIETPTTIAFIEENLGKYTLNNLPENIRGKMGFLLFKKRGPIDDVLGHKGETIDALQKAGFTNVAIKNLKSNEGEEKGVRLTFTNEEGKTRNIDLINEGIEKLKNSDKIKADLKNLKNKLSETSETKASKVEHSQESTNTETKTESIPEPVKEKNGFWRRLFGLPPKNR